MHTAESVMDRIVNDPSELEAALCSIRSTCGYCWGGWSFANSLIERLEDGRPLTERQTEAALDMLASYAVILARIANDKEKMQSRKYAPAPTVPSLPDVYSDGTVDDIDW